MNQTRPAIRPDQTSDQTSLIRSVWSDRTIRNSDQLIRPDRTSLVVRSDQRTRPDRGIGLANQTGPSSKVRSAGQTTARMLPVVVSLGLIVLVWLAGAVWSFEEQTALAGSRHFRVPQLLPLVRDGFALATGTVAFSASLEGRTAGLARLGTLLSILLSAASNVFWAYTRSAGEIGAMALAGAVPVVSMVAFEVLLHEIRRRVLIRRGQPLPAAVPAPRLIRLLLAFGSTFRTWRTLTLDVTDPRRAFQTTGPDQSVRPDQTSSDQTGLMDRTSSDQTGLMDRTSSDQTGLMDRTSSDQTGLTDRTRPVVKSDQSDSARPDQRTSLIQPDQTTGPDRTGSDQTSLMDQTGPASKSDQSGPMNRTTGPDRTGPTDQSDATGPDHRTTTGPLPDHYRTSCGLKD